MPTPRRPPVPSPQLLRFLRQSELVFFERPHNTSPLCCRNVSIQPLSVSPTCQRYTSTSNSPPAATAPTLRPLPSTPRQLSILQRLYSSRLYSSRIPLSAATPKTHSPPPPTGNMVADHICNDKCAKDVATPKPKPRWSWQETLWGPTTPKASDELNPEDDESNFVFNKRRTLSAKAALEPRLRCTEVDDNGEVILVDGEFKKSELIAKYGLLPRDLRKIDSSNLPHILVRPSAILLNLLHLKVLIMHNRVLLFEMYGSNTSFAQSSFMYDLQGKLRQKHIPGSGSLPYEFRALEAVLMSVTSELESDFEAVREPVIRILSDLEDDIDRHKLRVLLILSKRMNTFEQKAKLVMDAIEELLETDEDLSAMYLTEKAHDLVRAEDDHTEVEMLLESYHKLCVEIVQEAGNLTNSIRNTEEILRTILDANRNALMLLGLKFSIGTLGIALGTFIAGLYGMNLENFIENTQWGFGTVTGVSVVLSLVVCALAMVKLRKTERLKMYGDMGQKYNSQSSGKQHWFQDDGPVALLEARNREKLRHMNQQKAIVHQKKKKWWDLKK